MNEGVAMYLKSFHLTTVVRMLPEAVKQAEEEAWGYERFLTHLCESEYEERQQRRVTRLLKASSLDDTKTFAAADPKLWAVSVRRLKDSLITGDFLGRNENILAFGLPGRGKTHFLQAVCRELILRQQTSVLFISTVILVERLLKAKNELCLEQELRRLDRFEVICVDELGYTEHRRDEMEVFFLFLAHRYERRSVMISSNLVFSEWGRIFKDAMTGMAAVDRLVHHSIILNFSNESIRDLVARERLKK